MAGPPRGERIGPPQEGIGPPRDRPGPPRDCRQRGSTAPSPRRAPPWGSRSEGRGVQRQPPLEPFLPMPAREPLYNPQSLHNPRRMGSSPRQVARRHPTLHTLKAPRRHSTPHTLTAARQLLYSTQRPAARRHPTVHTRHAAGGGCRRRCRQGHTRTAEAWSCRSCLLLRAPNIGSHRTLSCRKAMLLQGAGQQGAARWATKGFRE